MAQISVARSERAKGTGGNAGCERRERHFCALVIWGFGDTLSESSPSLPLGQWDDGEDLHVVTVGVGEVEASAAIAGVDFARVRVGGIGVVGDACGTDSVEDGIEVVVADEERAMLRMELLGVVVVERDAICHLDRHEVTDLPWWVHAEDRGEKTRRTDLVSAGDDDVVQLDRHRHLALSPA